MRDYTAFKYSRESYGRGFFRGVFALLFDLAALLVWIIINGFKILAVIVVLLLGYYTLLGPGFS